VLSPCQYLEQHGFAVTYLKPDHAGLITAEQVGKALRDDTILVSVMYANNEIGTIEPIADIGRVIKQFKQERNLMEKNNNLAYPYFHTDACQAAGWLDLKVSDLGVDLMTVSASKIYGPKGVGALFVHRDAMLEPLIMGGGQERNFRSGTENVPLIAGLAAALRLAQAEAVHETRRVGALRDWFVTELKKNVPQINLNGSVDARLVNNIHLTIPGVNSETLLVLLDQAGIFASTGSACAAGIVEPSHVLLALGLSPENVRSSLRLTLGKKTTQAELEYVLQVLPNCMQRAKG